MSRLAEPELLRPSRLLERESYALFDPSDPAIPQVVGSIRSILSSRVRALEGFFEPIAQVVQELWRHLVADACIATLLRLGIHVRGADDVRAYLAGHPDLLEPVIATGRIAIETCTLGDMWMLEVSRDAETATQDLVLLLRRTHYGDDTLAIVDTVSDAAEALLVGRTGWLLVATDFQPSDGR